MSSPFSSALAKLDDSLQTVQIQIDKIDRGLDTDEDRLRRSVADACHYATILSALIRAQRSRTNPSDRAPLDQLFYEVNLLKRIQKRRLKLLNLATELSAGRVKHHRINRGNALNQLRLEAVKELQGAATSSSGEIDLPGPRSSKWLAWACGLREETDAGVLQDLRRDFPAVEGFIADMDECYWVSGDHSAAELSSVLAEGEEDESELELPAVIAPESIDTSTAGHDQLARDLLARFEQVLRAGESPAPSPSDDSQPTAASEDFRQSDTESADAWVATESETRLVAQPRDSLAKPRSDKAACLEFMKVVNAWQLDDSQARRLLGISRTLFNQIREGERVALDPEKLTRISLLVAIHKGINVLYGIKRGEKWVHRPNSNPLFEGSEPLKYLLNKGVDGLLKVRELVGVWSGYVTPE